MESIVILDIVVMWLVKHAVGVVITIGIFVSYPSYLTKLHMRVRILVRILALESRWHVGIVAGLARPTLLCEVLASQEEHLFMEATDDWNFWLLLRLVRVLLI